MADDDDDDQSSSSIPSMVDGLTPMDRTTVVGILKEQLVKDFSHYYYGENCHGKQNLVTTEEEEETGGMADDQNYAAATGINLVHPRYVFHPSDEPLLTYFFMDNLRKRIENVQEPMPTCSLMPVIPIVLLNGRMGGIKYDPWDVIAYFRQRLQEEEEDTREPVHIRPCIDGVIRKRAPEGILKAAADGREAFIPPPDDDQMKKACTLLLDKEGGKKNKYSLEQVLEEFFTLRLQSYEERKSAMLDVIESATEDSAYGEEDSDAEEDFDDILGYNLKDEVLYAETKNYLLRSFQYRMWDIEVGNNYKQSSIWWRQIRQAYDFLQVCISAEDLWLTDLDALQEQLDEQYKKQEPCEVRSSSLEEDVSLVQVKDEPKMGKKRIREQDDEEDEAETRKELRAT